MSITWHEHASLTQGHPWGEPTEWQYAETNDPRVVVVIERDWDCSVGVSMDGDAINPIYYREWRGYGRVSHVAGWVDDEVAEAWTRAYQVWDEPTADRFVRIFYGAEVAHVSGGGDRDGEYMVFDTPAFREHIGLSAESVDREAAELVSGEVSSILDGDVWGVGYAVNEGRLLKGGEIDLDDGRWDVQIECWGLVGELYARQEAWNFSFAQPDLPELLDVEL